MNNIFELYKTAMEKIPLAWQYPLAIIILLIIIFSFLKFVKKNLLWIIIFIALLPASYPAIITLYEGAKKLLEKIPK
ncbi:MAG: hypothetical protein BWY43_00826 [candidate division WS2 bacterium ADurb.Bin280]|uniref:Uncharacterized protein n=1 Tax=candidate division WS2 bacterium ADurb.Bin280 TaxID=1852829 RepID=A0A1V5SB98_9BACT|nr:MAG: hypothetical protein BWY43_00826 [candidate division WS2 bacterium ADurb.Bin280]